MNNCFVFTLCHGHYYKLEHSNLVTIPDQVTGNVWGRVTDLNSLDVEHVALAAVPFMSPSFCVHPRLPAARKLQ